ncbi:hypothetical protein TVAG_556320 [Trichomonas vaginalis G3]|uniref:Uncharacterized protein n=1 Tax=Trichomonas vaginalis (strain ATCC PRA-98 / G3) TaxID=412133 RepID=A2HL99_TRIV3|nr:hypothetical protein TVAG_556320 [Trichomonas vaginalis G3]|eukprot:XP_001282748.1 hypothetical protein [Trichomonas vaginalis G3]
MESTVSVATIKEIVEMLTNPSQETYIQATAQKNQILTDQRNAYELLQMLLTQNMPDSQRSLILDLLTDFIRQHNKDLALYEIHKSLFEINPEFCQSPLVISKLQTTCINC